MFQNTMPRAICLFIRVLLSNLVPLYICINCIMLVNLQINYCLKSVTLS